MAFMPILLECFLCIYSHKISCEDLLLTWVLLQVFPLRADLSYWFISRLERRSMTVVKLRKAIIKYTGRTVYL